jgi:hypothetical protein
VKAGCRGADGAWVLPSDHSKRFGYVGLGGHHLTDHRRRLHNWITSFLGAPIAGPDSASPGTGRRIAGPRLGPLRPAGLQESGRMGLCQPDR